MPYITKEVQKKIDLQGDFPPNNAGELNYLFTMIGITYLRYHGLKYQHLNDVIGALEGAKLEMYRRVAGPYEDTKITENGDVYPSKLLSSPWPKQ